MAGEWGRYCKLRADAHGMSECSGQDEVPPVVTFWGRQWSREERLAGVGRLDQVARIRTPRRYRMASGNGARMVPPAVPMTIAWIGAGEFVLEPGRGHAIDPEPTSVYP